MAWSLGLLPVSQPASRFRSSSAGQRVVLIIILCPGKRCAARYAEPHSPPDCTRPWDFDLRRHSPLSSRPDRYSPILGACVPLLTMRLPAGHASHGFTSWGPAVRTIGYTTAALLCGALAHQTDHTWSFAIRVGLVTGLVTGIGITVNPFIEYYADNLPERRLGAFGIGLILCGFALQSLQYWLALFDVRLT